MAGFDVFLRSLRDEFGEQQVGTKFEAFCKWYLETDPEWSRIVDKVWLWTDYPNKWQNQDLGTDLVFRDKNGLIWAVQSKCYSEHRATTKSDVNSFLADTSRAEVDRRLWMQTSNLMASTAQKTLVGQEKPTTVLRLDDFRESDLEYPNSFAELYKAKQRPKPQPELHQEEAISAVKEALKDKDRGQLIMACGTGKTFTTLWIKEALHAQSTLVLLPSLSLLSQTMREWAWAGNTEFEILNVCSDQSVGRQTEDMSVNDAPFPVTSDPNEIASFLQKSSPKVVFCTYQSSPLITDALMKAETFSFDLAIADEAHRCAGKADAGFATILDGNKIRAAKRLFTTATPRYYGKSVVSKAEGRGLEVVGMNDEAIFGPVVHQLTFGEAIQRDLLTDYQVVVVGVDDLMVKSLIDERELLALSEENHTDAESLAAKIGLIKACKDYDLKRIISFHSRVKGAKEFSEEFTDIASLIDPAQRPSGVFLTDYVSGEMNAGDRKNKIDRLKGLEGFDRGILANARCLAEGVDVPSLDGVAFIDPRSSQVEIIQAVGRAIRKVRCVEVQKKGTIVIPVFIQDCDTVEESIEESNFKPVWDVLKALRAHDEVLADELDSYRTDLGRRPKASNRESLDKIVFDLPLSVGSEFSDSLRTFVVEQSTESWEFWYGLLEVFKECQGHCDVPISHITSTKHNLGKWVSKQRSKSDLLSADKKQRLDALGFIWDPLTAQWEEAFRELSAYHQEHGNCSFKVSYVTESGFKLGGWSNIQRQNLKNNRLSDDRKQRLDALGFIWDPTHEAWEQGFRELHSYQKEHGNCTVGSTYITDTGYKLGQWVSAQRSAFSTSSLPLERKQRLESLGFVWDLQIERWEEGFGELSAYHQEHGDCEFFQSYVTETGFKLGVWADTQRQNLKKNKLSDERKERLEALGFVWDSLTEKWEKGFRELSTYHQEHGNSGFPNSYITEAGFKLGLWAMIQRGSYNKGKLSGERKKRLEALGFVWDQLTEQWEEGFRELSTYYEAHGNCVFSALYTTETEFKLGVWADTQRQNLKKNKLSEERKERLEALGFVWDQLAAQWEEGFRELSIYHQEHGNCAVPQSHITETGYRLGRWTNKQRQNLKNNKLSDERKKRLEALGFVWEPKKRRPSI
jgi:superfamily II DNA or RNA helicase/DNA-binding TFAR19-related protein (PDSD5 family)